MAEIEATWPWLKAYPPGIDWHARFADEPVYQLLEDSVRRYGDRPCLDFLGKAYSYADVGALVRRAAKGFAALGVKHGTRVGLMLPNCPYYVIAHYAILAIGGTVVNLNPLYAPPEVRHLVEDAGIEVMLTLDLKAHYAMLAPLLGPSGIRKIVLCPMADILPWGKSLLYRLLKRADMARAPRDDAHLTFADLTANDGAFAPVPIEPARDLAVLQYTGGTTGVPKGAMLTHRNLVTNARQCLAWFPDMEPGRERILAVLPFFHVFAMTATMNFGIASGSEIILLPRFEIKTLLAAIRRKRPTTMPGVPTLFTAVYTDPAAGKIDLSSIKFCISGGAPLPLEVKHKFEAVTRCTVVEGYGLSETSPVVACNPLRGVNKPGSVGLPVPGTIVEIASLDDPERLAPQGERGEVVVRGPQVMAGYWRKPQATAEVLRDGRLRTGDVGYLDPEGYLFLVDRLKDIIIAGGYKIYPRNVEEAIYQHPKVAECIVLSVADAYRGQTVKAYVAPVAGASLDEAELRAFLRDKLSPIEMPKLFEFRSSLPKTLIGKPSKKALIEEEARRAAGLPAQAPPSA
ncbi:MAG: long-chain-fatty-acid--CoA ligase [Stellaceae bacterium]